MKRIHLLIAVTLVAPIVGIVTLAQEPKAAIPNPTIRSDLIDPAAGADLGRNVAASAPSQPALPVAQVVLYSSGVGYFERDGQVENRTQVDLRFKVENINDLLKSVVVQDFD